MPLVKFVKTAAGPQFGPYQLDDVASFTSQTVTDLGDAVVLVTDPAAVPTDPTGTA